MPKDGVSTLGLQIAQSRSYLYTSRPNVGIIYVLGAMRLWLFVFRNRTSGFGHLDP